MIPFGLLGITEREKKQRGPFNPGEGYWLGNRFVFPAAQMPFLPPQQPASQPPAAPGQQPQQEPPPEPGRGILASLPFAGDGAQTEGFGPTAPAPGLAPAQGLAQATPAADKPASDQRGMPNVGMPVGLPGLPTYSEPNIQKDLIAEVKDFVNKTAPGSVLGKMGMPGIATAYGESEEDMAAAMGQLDAEYGAKTPAEAIGMGMGMAGLGGADPAGPAGAGDHQGASDPGQAPGGIGGAGDAPYHKGGMIPNRGAPALEDVNIRAKESEFVLRPEASRYYGKGILGAINDMKIPKKKLRGLLGL